MRKIFLGLLGFTLFGCATPSSYEVRVDSISSATASYGKKYILLPANKETNPRDIQFREYASYVHKVLMARGFEPAKDFASAEIVIMLSYGIGDPKEHGYSYSAPVIGQTGVASSQTTGFMSSYGRYSNYQGYTTHTPTYGVTGYTQYSGTYSTCNRFIMLNAFNLKTKAKNVSDLEVWKTIITSNGSRCDLRAVFPGILLAAASYIGANTGEKVAVSIETEDPSITELKQSPTLDFDVQLPVQKDAEYVVGENRKISLNDDTVISGKILADKADSIDVETKYGKVSVPKKDIRVVE